MINIRSDKNKKKNEKNKNKNENENGAAPGPQGDGVVIYRMLSNPRVPKIMLKGSLCSYWSPQHGEKGVLAPLSIIGHVTYAPLSGVYECPLCSHGPRDPVGV